MSENKSGRRGFLKSVALAAGGASQGRAAQDAPAQGKPPAASETAAAPAQPGMQYPRVYRGRQLTNIAFPLGGVGAGSLSLGGRGQLRDWEIFNRPDKGRSVPYSFPSIWAQAGGGKPVARVLEARMLTPFMGPNGSGLSPSQAAGLARLEDAVFTGEYPLARVAFRDRKLPVRVTLEAFTPFVPHDAEGSGMPVAVLRYRVANPGKTKAKVSIAWSLDNPAGVDLRGLPRGSRPLPSQRINEFRHGSGIDGLFMTNPTVDPKSQTAGSFALCLLGAGDGNVSHLTGWPRAKWWASPLLFWDDFTSDGALGPEPEARNAVGSLCLQREIAPGAEAEYTFLLAWHFPNRTPDWCGWTSAESDRDTVIGNHYCTRFADAWKAAEAAAEALPALEKRMRQFLAAVRESTVPAAVKDAAMSNLSTLATTTCFRTADGKFRGFEGSNDDKGCCHGNCTHVWNYESATHYVFPSLARSMREQSFDLSSRLDGVLPIRLALPEGKQKGGITAADGSMGQVIKTYLDWQLSGDTEWMKGLWPKVRQAMEFCWVEGGWDGDRDGVMEGVQHNTYDVEFYGPNPMCGVYYLGGLRAAEEMARAAGDAAFAERCHGLFQRGSEWIDSNLFNGQYYIQKIRAIPKDKIAKPLWSTGGAENPEKPDFQLGEGCLADQLIGQYLADVAGLGPLLKTDNIRKTLAAIMRYNYRENLYEHDSTQRIYALNDEAAVLICDYGKVERPRIPFPYYAEAWTGIEYLVATQLIDAGMVKEGLRVYEAVRRRYDGERRNPWDEPECGHHYARAMSAWSGLVALGGFHYFGAERRVVTGPKLRGTNFSSFWSTATGWGTFAQSTQEGRTRLTLSVLYGKLPCASIEAACEPAAGAKSSAALGKKTLAHDLKRLGKRVVFVLKEPVELAEGDRLAVVV